MLYTMQKFPDEPIFFVRLHQDFRLGIDAEEFVVDSLNLLDRQSERVYMITDMTALTFSAMDVIHATNMVTRQYQLLKHPRIIESMIITPSQLVQRAAQGFDSPIFGNIKLRAFESSMAALDYVRGKIAAQSR